MIISNRYQDFDDELSIHFHGRRKAVLSDNVSFYYTRVFCNQRVDIHMNNDTTFISGKESTFISFEPFS